MTTVIVNVELFRFCQWAISRLDEDVRTWGLLRGEHRAHINNCSQSIRAAIAPFLLLSKQDIEMQTTKVREFRAHFLKLSERVHSARAVMTDDRRKALGLIRKVVTRFDGLLQLNLF